VAGSTVTTGLAETLHVLANEPSLGLYRLEEHVQRSVPQLVAAKVQTSLPRLWPSAAVSLSRPKRGPRVWAQHQLKETNRQLEGALHDTAYSLEYVVGWAS
jgi:hypothetical protein